MSQTNGFSPTQKKLLTVLSDGKRHEIAELITCIDQLSNKATLAVHISAIRPKLYLRGEDIVCVYRRGKRYYQHVRLLHSPATQS